MYIRKATVPGKTPQAAYNFMVFIWLLLIMSIFIYYFIARLAISQPGFSASGESAPLFPILVGISIIDLGIQVFLKQFLDDQRLFPKILKGISNQYHEGAVTGESLHKELIQRHYNISIVLWALGESIAIYGLVLTFISGDLRYITGFGAFAILNMIFLRPRRQIIEEQFSRLRRHLETGMPMKGIKG